MFRNQFEINLRFTFPFTGEHFQREISYVVYLGLPWLQGLRKIQA